MSTPQTQPQPPSLSHRALQAWQTNAAHWDATITKHGNKYWRRLQEPSLRRLLAPTLAKSGRGSSGSGGCRALDLATGNGLCARWLAANGARDVLATDGCEEMLEMAKGYWEGQGEGQGGGGEEGAGRMRFRKVDVTSEADLGWLVEEEGGFDVVVMNMAVMDVADLEPLARALARGLVADGGV